jgi:hypothetical protein
MKVLRPFILITIIISLCLGNEVFTNYSLNQNLALESLPTKPAPRRATAGIIAAEFFGSLVGGAGGFLIGGTIGSSLAHSNGLGFEDYEQMWAWIISGPIGLILGCAGGTCFVGLACEQNGKFLPTLAGSAAGLIVLSPFGSVIGYNLSRPKPAKQAFLYQHFDLPAFGFRTEKTKDNKVIPVYDFRLVNARF